MSDRNSSIETMSHQDLRELVPLWAAMCERFPRSMWPMLCSVPGAISVLRQGKRRRAELAETIGLAIGAGKISSRLYYAANKVVAAQLFADQAFFVEASERDLDRLVDRKIDVAHLGNLSQPNVLEDPTIILVNTFASHYYGLVALAKYAPRPVRLTIVQPKAALKYLRPLTFYEKLSSRLGLDIEVIEADSITSLAKALQAVKKRRHLALRVDSLPTEATRFVESSLLGAPSVYPMGILLLAHRSGAPLLNVGVVRSASKLRFLATRPVQVDSLEPLDLVETAKALDAAQGDLILRHPIQYSAWHGVHQKWRLAQEVAAHSASGR